jgi:DNA repair ATPase RecN
MQQSERRISMPTQEERITTLEQTFATFQKDNAANIREIEENTTILLGVIRHQGQDIKRIFTRLETIDQRLDLMDARLERLDQLETKLDEQTSLLTQILERLPRTP